MTGDDLDLYSSGDGRRVVSGLVRTLGVLLGVAIAGAGLGLFALRCFDYCPEDPSLDKVLQLLSAALVATGLVVVVEALSFRTRAQAASSAVVVALGALVALAGIVSLVLIPSIDPKAGDGGGTAPFAVLAVCVGGAIAFLRRPGRRQ